MARIDLPQSRLRVRKRRRRVLVVLLVVLTLAAMLGGLVALSRAPFLQVTSVVVSGVQTVATGSVASVAQGYLGGAYAYLFARDNIFLYPKEEIREALMRQYPQFSSVSVAAKDFHIVSVQVVERQPAAQWCPMSSTSTLEGVGLPMQTGCSLMDEDGVVYAPAGLGSAGAEASSTNVYVSYSGGAPGPLPRQYLNGEEFRSLTALVGALSQTEAGDPVERVAVDDDQDVLAYFKNGFLLLFTLKDDGGDVFERFNLALKSEPFQQKTLADFEYLDLRFGDKLYYKLRTQ